MKRVSLLPNILFNTLSLDIDQLFGEELQSMGISAAWTARSSVLRNTAELIPLTNIWNVQYARHSPAPPLLDSCDFARLYTNIETADMHAQIMELVVCIFALPQHSNHAGIRCGKPSQLFGCIRIRCLLLTRPDRALVMGAGI